MNNEEINFQEGNDLIKKTDNNYLDNNIDNKSSMSKTIEMSFCSDRSFLQNQVIFSRRGSVLNNKNVTNTNPNSNLNDINNDNESDKNIPFFLKSFDPKRRKSKINWTNEYNQFATNETQPENSIRSLIKRGSLRMTIKDKELKAQESRNENNKINMKQINAFSSKSDIKRKDTLGSHDSKSIKIESSINTTNNENNDKSSADIKKRKKFILLSQVKNLLNEIENEINQKGNSKKKKKKFKDTSYLFLQRNVAPQIPFLKERSQINNYLINDFKETESYQDYIKRSLKYRTINDNYESEQEKKLEENYNKQKANDESHLRFPSKRITEYSMNSKINHATKKQSYTNILSNINKANISITPKKKKINFKHDEDSFSIDNSKNKESPQRNAKKKNTTINMIYNNTFYKNFRNGNIKRSTAKKRSTKKTNNNCGYFDKYTLSNNMYNDHKRNYSEYQMQKRKMRSENFSLQMSNLEKDKHLYMTEGNEECRLPKLNENKLLYVIQLKNVFRNSFNSMTTFKNGDEDLGLDNLEKFKKSCIDTEIEMFAILKNKTHPNYIKSNFNKKTNKKYRSTRGVFFGV